MSEVGSQTILNFEIRISKCGRYALCLLTPETLRAASLRLRGSFGLAVLPLWQDSHESLQSLIYLYL